MIIDGTLGGGGHSEALLRSGASVLGIDRDPRALDAARTRLARFGDRFRAVQGDFGAVQRLIDAPADGLLLDLGVSSPQFDEPSRGFSFQADGPLDMRMGNEGPTAAELIGSLQEQELATVIFEYGEERFSQAIARSLKRAQPRTTKEAVTAIEAAVPRRAWPDKIHVATRTFQALRIKVNEELEQLDPRARGRSGGAQARGCRGDHLLSLARGSEGEAGVQGALRSSSPIRCRAGCRWCRSSRRPASPR